MIVKTDFQSLNKAEKDLVLASRLAIVNAYAPYSNFYVGAAVRLQSGKMLTGSNQENAVYPLSLCAERVCLLHWGHACSDDPVVALSVSCETPAQQDPVAFPCGSCRQVILESQQRGGLPVEILVDGGDDKIYRIDDAKDLLPFGFEADFLKK
ncbi:MAG: cytidine deaminase [Cyclobacteriaceae bacterium]|nr:cytidine deaminase [Cyclobacteriaceae bacterium]